MVDYKRRAERRKGFYDKIKKDPAEFLQIWGRSVKINIDPNIASAADNPSIMTTWRGNQEDTLIDRFDVRSHLDTYDEYNSEASELVLTEAEKNEEKMLNYERYRALVHNDAFGVTEKECLKQIELDEKFGCSMPSQEKKPKEPKAQIGYVYQDSTKSTSFSNAPGQTTSSTSTRTKSPESDLSDENEDDLDFNISVEKLTADNKIILNKCATNYGMECGDYVKFLLMEVEEKEKLKQNKLLEEEKAQYSGRKSRRERRIVKDRLRKERGGELSPLSYIIKNESSRSSSSSSSKSSATSSNARSSSTKPTAQNQITFITSFGGDIDENETDSVEHLLSSSKQQTESIINNVKRLRQNVTRNATSRSRSKSPVLSRNTKPKLARANNEKSELQKSVDNNDNDSRMSNTSSSSEETSDEEKALKKYMKRKEKRKNLQAKSVNSIASFNYSNNNNNKATDLKEIQQVLTSSATINNNDTANLDIISDKNDDIYKSNLNNNLNNSITNNGNSSAKIRSSGEFKLHQEKLKKKMQQQINKQLKKDKEVEREKLKKEREERREREAELTYLTEKMRQRKAMERRKDRRKQGLASSSSDTSRSRSRTRSRSRSRGRPRRSYSSRRSSPSRSRSRSRNRRRTQYYRSRSRNNNRASRYRSRSSSRIRSRRARRSRTRSRSSKKSYSKSSSSSSASRCSSNRRKRNRNSSSTSSNSSTTSSSSSTSPSISRINNKNNKKQSVTTSSDSSSD